MTIYNCIKIFNKYKLNNGLWLYALQLFNTVIPLITIPYITRILGASQYGVFSLALNFQSYLQVAVEYGFALSATRQVSFIETDRDLSKLFMSVMISRFILYILSIFVTGIYIVFSNKSYVLYECIFILSVSLIGYCFQENWLFQGKQEMKFISISSIIARTLTVLYNYILIRFFNIFGASLAPLLSETTLFFLLFWQVKKVDKEQNIRKKE